MFYNDVQNVDDYVLGNVFNPLSALLHVTVGIYIVHLSWFH